MFGGGQIRHGDGGADIIGGVAVLSTITGTGRPQLGRAAGPVITPGPHKPISLLGPHIALSEAAVVPAIGGDGLGIHDYPVGCRCQAAKGIVTDTVGGGAV